MEGNESSGKRLTESTDCMNTILQYLTPNEFVPLETLKTETGMEQCHLAVHVRTNSPNAIRPYQYNQRLHCGAQANEEEVLKFLSEHISYFEAYQKDPFICPAKIDLSVEKKDDERINLFEKIFHEVLSRYQISGNFSVHPDGSLSITFEKEERHLNLQKKILVPQKTEHCEDGRKVMINIDHVEKMPQEDSK